MTYKRQMARLERAMLGTAALLGAAALAGCGGSHGQAMPAIRNAHATVTRHGNVVVLRRSAERPAVYPRYGLSVRYPGSFARVDWCWTGPHLIPIGLLTTARPTPECTRPAVGIGASFPPAERLRKDGVSVELALQAVFPGDRTRWNARIGGRPAHVQAAFGRRYHAAVTCPAAVRRESRSVAVERPAATNQLLTVNAVVCGPHLAAGNAAVDRILASISFER